MGTLFGIHLDEALIVLVVYWIFSAATEAATEAFGNMDNRGVQFALKFFNLLSARLQNVSKNYPALLEKLKKSSGKTLGIFLLIPLLFLAGCGKKIEIANVPAGVSEAEVRAWYEATGILAVVSRSTRDATKAVIDLHGQGLFVNDASYQGTLAAFGKIAQTEILAAQYLDSWQEQFGAVQAQQFRGYMDRIADALVEATGSGLLGIKNEETRAAFLITISLIRSAVRQGLDLAALFQVSRRGLAPGQLSPPMAGQVPLEVRYV